MQFISNNKKYRVPFVDAFRIIYLNTELGGNFALDVSNKYQDSIFF